MTDPYDQLAALYTLALEWEGGVEKCPWWVEQMSPWECGWTYLRRGMCPQHALAIIRDAAERWLVGKGWEVHRDAGGIGYEHWVNRGENYLDKCFYTLIDALKYAKEQA